MASSGLWEPGVYKVRFHSRSADGTPRMMGDEWLPVLSRVKKMSKLMGVPWVMACLHVTEGVNVGPGADEVGGARYGFIFKVTDGATDAPLFQAGALTKDLLLKGLSDPKDDWDVDWGSGDAELPVRRAYF